MRSLILSLFSTNKNKKVVRTKIYLPRVVYMAARQALDKTRKFVKTMIYIYRVVYTAQMKARQALGKSNDYSEKNLITWTTHSKNKQGEDIQAKKTSTKNKESSFKKKYNILLQRLEYKGQIHQASSSGEEISILRLSTILLAKSLTSGSIFSTASRYS